MSPTQSVSVLETTGAGSAIAPVPEEKRQASGGIAAASPACLRGATRPNRCSGTRGFIAARHLLDGLDVRVAERGRTPYFHLMPERHEVIHAEGAGRERFHSNDPGMAAIPPPPS
ncbi:Hint domain-containing protein [Roseovarius pacificus]|uniref:Hint domain-containing protein n=1 Tax=Roseovarius pacificus TaxID=337701 RepID=UPI0027E4CC6D|nr:Hint domain-containing protein [Roseovarius pacificus]